jgi:hypothetical protein
MCIITLHLECSYGSLHTSASRDTTPRLAGAPLSWWPMTLENEHPEDLDPGAGGEGGAAGAEHHYARYCDSCVIIIRYCECKHDGPGRQMLIADKLDTAECGFEPQAFGLRAQHGNRRAAPPRTQTPLSGKVPRCPNRRLAGGRAGRLGPGFSPQARHVAQHRNACACRESNTGHKHGRLV